MGIITAMREFNEKYHPVSNIPDSGWVTFNDVIRAYPRLDWRQIESAVDYGIVKTKKVLGFGNGVIYDVNNPEHDQSKAQEELRYALKHFEIVNDRYKEQPKYKNKNKILIEELYMKDGKKFLIRDFRGGKDESGKRVPQNLRDIEMMMEVETTRISALALIKIEEEADKIGLTNEEKEKFRKILDLVVPEDELKKLSSK